MTRNDSFPRPFEVWRVAFFFEDKPNQYKYRPVVILDRDEKTGELLIAAAKVTSHAPRPDSPGEVVLQYWSEAGLAKPSVVRCSKVAAFRITDFEGCRKYGELSKADQTSVKRALEELGYF